MADDERLTWDFILEVLDVMERHGYRRSDNEHAGQAIGLIGDAARIYEGTLDAPRGGYVVVPSSRPAGTAAARPARRHRLGRRGQDPAGRAGRSRRIQAGPGRDVRRLRRPVLHHLPVAPAGRRRLRPAGRPDDPSRRGLHRPARAPPATRRLPAPVRRRPPTRRPDSDLAPNSPCPVHHQPATAGDGMKQPEDTDPRPAIRRPASRLRGRHQRQRLGQGALPGRRSQPVGRPAHRPGPPPRPRARPGSRTMTPTRK